MQIPCVKGLKYRANLGLDFNQNNGGNYTGQGVNSINLLTPSTAGVSNSQNFHWTLENLLTYDRTFGGKHSINAVALYSAEQNRYNRSSMSARCLWTSDTRSADPSSPTARSARALRRGSALANALDNARPGF